MRARLICINSGAAPRPPAAVAWSRALSVGRPLARTAPLARGFLLPVAVAERGAVVRDPVAVVLRAHVGDGSLAAAGYHDSVTSPVSRRRDMGDVLR
jgi:hypothetical protein